LSALAGGLRRTDLWTVQGGRARMLLHGVEEGDVGVVLDRLGLVGTSATTAPATGDDLLVGPGLDPSIDTRADLASTASEAPT
jgi:hypothetical protein